MAPRKKTPDGWVDYRPIKDVFPDVKIVPFKTPLNETKFVADNMVAHRWTTFDLMDYLRDMGWELGVVVDFTNKYPAYYNPEDFDSSGVDFIKIGLVGQSVPEEECYYRFCDVVDKFLWYEGHNNRVIGVHCTHGINRTGYMICRYLIEKRGYHPDEAIQAFARIRGYPIERQNYIEDLYRLAGIRY